MVSTLPVPIEFRLPDGWEAAPPDEVGAPGAAFVALHRASYDNFTANITISGELRTDPATLHEIADESIERLEKIATDVALTDRDDAGSDDAPATTQLVRMTLDKDGTPVDLVQCQVYLVMPDIHDPQIRAVIQLALTATRNQAGIVGPDFQTFVDSVQPALDQMDESGE
ncbi:MAG TPA: hypothetical protein VE172_19030 [Stackebrandtia sp.]|jgi:hypothetical protein|uniref:hypothetical protein n=1 Tax=Stackebrandtia sp. TaxID=2023065 RepID=UPI002D3CD9ED|nr:hypothetical protein [Stackebrandtia sp.]HZE40897.1 hypothetical protein [Stackebrandtia sp.]